MLVIRYLMLIREFLLLHFFNVRVSCNVYVQRIICLMSDFQRVFSSEKYRRDDGDEKKKKQKRYKDAPSTPNMPIECWELATVHRVDQRNDVSSTKEQQQKSSSLLNKKCEAGMQIQTQGSFNIFFDSDLYRHFRT